jgi:hydroxypyruvate reductase
MGRAGADVVQVNTVRRALSLLKGGGLSRLASPARVLTLALSDVVGDAPEAIGSGPSVPSPTGSLDALRVLRDTGVLEDVPELGRLLRRWADSRRPAARFRPGRYFVVASVRDAAEAARRAAVRLGFRAEVTTLYLQGEAREVGRLIGSCAVSLRERAHPFAPPGCLVFAGETTVTRRGRGRGGRSLELALGAAVAMAGVARTAVFAFATDGVDGSSDAAGAVATGDTIRRARAAGMSADEALARSDSHTFFERLGDLWRSGPTGTNVNDLAIALAYSDGGRT